MASSSDGTTEPLSEQCHCAGPPSRTTARETAARLHALRPCGQYERRYGTRSPESEGSLQRHSPLFLSHTDSASMGGRNGCRRGTSAPPLVHLRFANSTRTRRIREAAAKSSSQALVSYKSLVLSQNRTLGGHHTGVPVLPPTALQEKVIRCVGKDGHPTGRVDGWRVNGHGESASSCPGR
jgi:hypothetical protein